MNLICRDPFVRHTLRLTCQQMRFWLPVNKEFTYKLSVLCGLQKDKRCISAFLFRMYERLYEYKLRFFHDDNNKRLRIFPFKMDFGKRIEIHSTGYYIELREKVMQSITGFVSPHVVHMALIDFLGTDYCTMLFSFISIDQMRFLFDWHCCYDFLQCHFFILGLTLFPRFFPRVFFTTGSRDGRIWS